jgi:predicted  nucleic acid-binding Zn-ribbon protein
LPNAATALREELTLGEDAFDPATAKKYETLLEKKWTSVVRLQKKVCCHLRKIDGAQSLMEIFRLWT